MLLGEVIIEYPSSSLDRPFYYAYNGEKDLTSGVRVIVPFANKKIIGYVLNVIKTNETLESLEQKSGYKIKYIEEIIDQEKIIDDELIELAKRVSKYYFAPLIQVLQTMLPPSLKPNSSSLSKPKIAYEIYVEPILNDASLLTEKQKEIYFQVIKETKVKKSLLSPSIVKTLIKKNYLKEIQVEKIRIIEEGYENLDFYTLNDEQNAAKNAVISNTNTTFLLQGVTGSGKTEVYLHLTREYLKQNKSVLVLLPEISLTYQVVRLFKQRFKNIAVLHSALTNSEKYDEYRRISSNEVKVVIGARSAIFAPLKNIGLIIIDEEHSETYKQDVPPYYHALTVAKMRQEYHKCNILLGSATPSLESRARAFKGNYKLLMMNKRFKTSLPNCQIVDMSNLNEVDDKSVIYSKTLREKIKDRLEKKEQVLLLFNRRGYAQYVSCRKCSYVFKCPTCDLPLAYHKDYNLLKCHHCGYVANMVSTCPKCDSPYIRTGGIGLQKAEEELKVLYPDARILRLDSDVAKKRLATKEIIEKFKNNDADILIGTQMISKGLDFKNVTLSCIVLADIGLNIPSYRASERVFSLLTQTIGRAGRSEKGEAIIQTYLPNHYAIQYAAKQDYEGFFALEMKYRKISVFPPFSYCTIISLGAIKENDLLENLLDIKNFLIAQFVNKKVEVIGPSEYYVSFYNGKFRRKFLLKYFNYNDIVEPLKKLKEYLLNNKKITLNIDVDPYVDY